jgi:hypothetical protein
MRELHLILLIDWLLLFRSFRGRVTWRFGGFIHWIAELLTNQHSFDKIHIEF